MKIFSNKFEDFVMEMITNIRTKAINPRKTVVININTVNGFYKKGEMYSSFLEETIPKLVEINEYFVHSDKIFFVDRHTENSSEFSTFPPHCVEGLETEIIEELSAFSKKENSYVFPKNSTNAFFVSDFSMWLRQNLAETENFIIVGAETDIEIMQFALSLKTYLDQFNKKREIIVIENAVQTFGSDGHDASKMHVFALYNMILNGVNIHSI